MSLKDQCFKWVEERIWENEDGTFSIYDPVDDTIESKKYSRDEICDVLWNIAVTIDAPTLYGIDA